MALMAAVGAPGRGYSPSIRASTTLDPRRFDRIAVVSHVDLQPRHASSTRLRCGRVEFIGGRIPHSKRALAVSRKGCGRRSADAPPRWLVTRAGGLGGGNGEGPAEDEGRGGRAPAEWVAGEAEAADLDAPVLRVMRERREQGNAGGAAAGDRAEASSGTSATAGAPAEAAEAPRTIAEALAAAAAVVASSGDSKGVIGRDWGATWEAVTKARDLMDEQEKRNGQAAGENTTGGLLESSPWEYPSQGDTGAYSSGYGGSDAVGKAEEAARVAIIRGYERRAETRGGTVVVRPMAGCHVAALTEMLTDSFMDYMGGMTFKPLLRMQISVYVAGRLRIVPHGVMLVATLEQPPHSSNSEPDAASSSSSSSSPPLSSSSDVRRYSLQQQPLQPGAAATASPPEGPVVGVVELALTGKARPAFPTLDPPPDAAYLCNMAVGHQYRRLGIARVLLSAVEELAAALGATSMCLHCRLVDTPPFLLYSSAGYTTLQQDHPLAPLLTFQRRRRLMQRELTGSGGEEEMGESEGGVEGRDEGGVWKEDGEL
ncbi:unnamed protein product [Closterium sp. NIES-53]